MSSSRGSAGLLPALLALLPALLPPAGCAAPLPVLCWSNCRLLLPSSASEGSITSMEQLTFDLNSVFSSGPNTVVLFLQEQLSKEDFTMFGGAFGDQEKKAFRNLEAAMDSSSSSSSLAVAWSSSWSILSVLQEALSVSALKVEVDSLSQVKMDDAHSLLLLLRLPYCSRGQRSCVDVLKENDEVVGRVQSFMKNKDVKFTSIYTGERPSTVFSLRSEAPPLRGRSLLQVSEEDALPPIIFNGTSGPCILLWAQNLNVSFSPSGSWTDLNSQNPSLAGSACNESNSLLVLTYPTGTTLRFSMSRRFYPVSARFWFTLDWVQLQVNGSSALFSGNRSVYAPAEFSFHCQQVSSLRDGLLEPSSTEGGGANWRLSFVDFQIQGFGLSNSSRFSYSSDCASFFSSGILMGLLTSALLLLLLLYGLTMLTALSSAHRYHDDKGGAIITVPQSD